MRHQHAASSFLKTQLSPAASRAKTPCVHLLSSESRASSSSRYSFISPPPDTCHKHWSQSHRRPPSLSGDPSRRRHHRRTAPLPPPGNGQPASPPPFHRAPTPCA